MPTERELKLARDGWYYQRTLPEEEEEEEDEESTKNEDKNLYYEDWRWSVQYVVVWIQDGINIMICGNVLVVNIDGWDEKDEVS